MANRIVVIGAGVSGLTTALLLSKSTENSVTVVAKDMPGDFNASYASPWAGANFVPQHQERDSRWERHTWPELKRLALEVPEAGIHFQKMALQRSQNDTNQSHSGFPESFAADPWFRTLFEDFRELKSHELAEGCHAGYIFTTVCINTAIYLPWLLGQCAKNGVVFERACLSHIREAPTLHHSKTKADFIINCTGLGSLGLGGVEDNTMMPARGQTVLVRNKAPSMLMVSATDDTPTEELYLMERAVGGGTVLGGTYELGNWDPDPNPDLALRIMARVVAAYPEITKSQGIKGLSIIKHGVGFRPYRAKGVRVEKERMHDGTWVIHNYGHDSWGYIASYGCAEGVLELFAGIHQWKNQKDRPHRQQRL